MNDDDIIVPRPGDKSPLADTAAKKAHPKESGHWYSRDCRQVLEVPRANGKGTTRTTLAHARKMDLGYGVTTICGCADKPQLTLWKQRQAIMAALTLPRSIHETERDWMARVEIDMASTAAAAAQEGTRIHAAVQSRIEGKPWDPAYDEHVKGVMRVFPAGEEWEAERTVVHYTGYGTKADLSSHRYLIDFKSKDGDQETLDGLTTYDEHAMQLAATREAILHTDSSTREIECGILYVSRTHPGAASLRWVGDGDLFRGWEMFQALLIYWKAKNNHRPWQPDF